MIEQINEAVNYIKSKTDFIPEYGIILGTGLGSLIDDVELEAEIPYKAIPNFPISTVESHNGKLGFGTLEGKKVVVMQGRMHFYEGYSMKQVVFPTRVLKFLGIKKLFVSNAAGSLNEHIDAGDLMIIRDHINLQPSNPFIGENIPELGSRFPDPIHAYDQDLVFAGLDIARKNDIDCHSGVYVSVPGPVLETPAEYKYLHIIGGDAVGMSTVPEVLAACQMGIPVFAISVITDKGYPIEEAEPVTFEKVFAVAKEAEPKMTLIIKGLIKSV